ncbi:MAG: hypothetical protein L6R41_004856 [Letrouitia leprolyta]|nr:MAG: hypothetical protein L6R41_004856 [Letrouitia leprolyta]
MPSITRSLMAVALAFFTTTNAHMMLKTPAPYGLASLNNSPLDATGSDFPCKLRQGVYDPPATRNVMSIGAPQTLSFTGGATHGGGSCQISLTKDLKPTKDSKWMVIHSIEGGCPSAAPGNAGGDPNASAADKFQYKIPQGISPGEYTLAWTWFNKVGNREMYMNCAPITVTGGGSKRRDLHEPCHNDTEMYNATETYASDEIFKRDASFPEMFKANIPATDCTTAEGSDVEFPNPGASVAKGSSAALGKPTGPKCGGGSSSGSSNAAAPAADGSGSAPGTSSGSASGSSSGSGSFSGSASPAAPAPSSAITIQAIPPAGAPAAGAPIAAASSVASAAQSVVSAAASVMSAAAPAPTGSSSNGAGAAGAPSGSCTPGATVCSPDGTQFGICSGGNVVMQRVAAGTSCKNGIIGFAKRSAKFGKVFNA